MMNKKEKKVIQSIVESEGFDYTFRYYSGFQEVKDMEFHRLLSAYVKAAKDLADYVGLDSF